MSTLVGTSDAPIFYPCLKSCTLHRESSGGTRGPPMIQFVSLERESQDPEFQKKYLKLVDEEPTRSCRMRWKNSSESFSRYRSRRAFQKNRRRMCDCKCLQLLHLCLQCCDRFLRVHVAAIDLLPIDVLHEGVNVFSRRCAVVHLIRVLIHIEHKQRQSSGALCM